MSRFTRALESATRKKIDLILTNLGWNTDEGSAGCNVYTERGKTVEQRKKLRGKKPDYVLYQSETDDPIAIIETKRSGQSLQKALEQAIDRYAKPLDISIIFVTDGTIVETYDLRSKTNLRVDDQIVTEFISEKQLLRFVKEGSRIHTPQKITYYDCNRDIKKN